MECLDGRVEGTRWDARGSAVRSLGRQDVDALCAQLDRVGDRRVVDHAAVDQPLVADRDRGEDPWDRRRRKDGLHGGTFGEEQFASLDQVKRDQMERDWGIGEIFKLDVPSDQSPQLTIRHEVIAPPAHAADEGTHAERKDVLPLKVAPHSA